MVRSFVASDGYPLHVRIWPAEGQTRGQVVVLHGVQSHGGWYHGLGRSLAAAGYTVSFPDRRGSGANALDRGHARSARRLNLDLAEWLRAVRSEDPGLPIALAGISWGGKLAMIAAARHPELVDAIVLICPGLHPRVGVSRVPSDCRSPGRFSRIGESAFRSRSPTLRSSPPIRRARRSSPADPYSLREGTAGLLAASFIIDRLVARAPGRIHQPALLMLAGQDRIVDNAQTLAYFERLASTERRGDRISRGPPYSRIRPRTCPLCSGSCWLARSSSPVNQGTRMPEPWNRPNASFAS